MKRTLILAALLSAASLPAAGQGYAPWEGHRCSSLPYAGQRGACWDALSDRGQQELRWREQARDEDRAHREWLREERRRQEWQRSEDRRTFEHMTRPRHY